MTNELILHGVIGADGLTSTAVKASLAEMDQSQPLLVHIDSNGGSVLQGFSIFKAIENYPGPTRAVVESAAFSIASYLAMACDEIDMADNGYLMIHNPSVTSDGDDEQHIKDAELLAKLKQSMIEAYAGRSGMPQDKVRELMKAETYFTAAESVERGFATRVLGSSVKSNIPVTGQGKLPLEVVASLLDAPSANTKPKAEETPMPEKNEPVAASVKDIKAIYPQATSDFVVMCMDKEMTAEDVGAAAMEDLQSQNEALRSEVEALKAEKEEATAAADEAAAAAKAEGESKAAAEAKAKGNQPVAVANGEPGGVSATEKFRAELDSAVKQGVPRVKALQAVNRRFPGLREQMLAEANAK